MFAIRPEDTRANTPGWTIRVVPNKYPALTPRASRLRRTTGSHHQVVGRGFHEVIIETPDHREGLGSLNSGELSAVLRVYRHRVRALAQKRSVKSIALFRNEGMAAGASQAHPHAQVLALPIVSGKLAREVASATRHLRRRGRCIMCEMLEVETPEGNRFIAKNPDFVALAAFAPRFPYETWIVPRAHGHEFSACDDRQLQSLASIVTELLYGLRSVLGQFPFNFVVQSAPVRVTEAQRSAYHWRLEVIPRLTVASGFELGSGFFIVSIPPEEAGRALRAALGGRGPNGERTPLREPSQA